MRCRRVAIGLGVALGLVTGAWAAPALASASGSTRAAVSAEAGNTRPSRGEPASLAPSRGTLVRGVTHGDRADRSRVPLPFAAVPDPVVAVGSPASVCCASGSDRARRDSTGRAAKVRGPPSVV